MDVPLVDDVTSALEVIFNFIKNSDECQFSLSKLMNLIKGYVPTEKTIKRKLKEKYGNDIILSTNKNKVCIVCFRNTGYKILTNHWYEQKNADEHQERLRIIKAAAAIIREDIRTQIYDTLSYPSSDNFLKDVNNCISESLDTLLKNIIVKRRKCQPKQLQRKCTSIAHAIISATRPRSFISPLQLSVAIFCIENLDQKIY